MTTPVPLSAKDQVLAWVRSKNPSTMELKDGCVVQYVFPHGQIAMQGAFIGKGGHYGNAELWGLRVQNCVMPIPNKNHFEKTAQILGSDMGLQELQRAFAADGIQMFVDEDGKLYQPTPVEHTPDGLELGGDVEEVGITFDLTKNLHSQSEEFYQALLPLIS